MLSVVPLSVVMLSVIMLSVIMLCVIMLSVVMLSVIMLSVVILTVTMLSVVAQFTPDRPLQYSVVFESNEAAYPSAAPLRCPFQSKHLALPTNHGHNWRALPWAKTLDY
jgi:hypothetical protein